MQTPMNRMQDHFKKLNTLTQPMFSKVELSHKKSQYNSYINDGEGGQTKGVTSDFIRIYKPSRMNKDTTSFAFAFNNYQHNLDNTLVTVSIKTNKTLEVMNLDFPTFFTNFKMYLQKIEKLQQAKKLTATAIVKNLKKVFPTSAEAASNLDYVQVVESIKNQTQKQFEKVTTLHLKQNTIESQLEEKRNSVQKKLEAMRSKLEKEAGLPALRRKLEGAAIKNKEAQLELAGEVDKIISQLLKENANTPINKLKENLRKELNQHSNRNEKDVYSFLRQVVVDRLK